MPVQFIQLLLTVTLFLSPISNSRADDFILLESLNFTNRPKLSEFGLERLHIVYTGHLWRKHDNKDTIPSEKRISNASKLYNKAKNSKYIAIDIEHWRTSSIDPELARNNIRKLNDSYEKIKKHFPKQLLGYYSVLPIRDYWRAIKRRRGYEQWKMENNQLAELASNVDVIYPSLYTFYNDPKRWKRYAQENISEARRLSNNKQPVICFLSPRYHISNKKIGGKLIDENFFYQQLKTIYTYADGVVVWDGRKIPWDDTSPFWLALQRFIREIS